MPQLLSPMAPENANALCVHTTGDEPRLLPIVSCICFHLYKIRTTIHSASSNGMEEFPFCIWPIGCHPQRLRFISGGRSGSLMVATLRAARLAVLFVRAARRDLLLAYS